MSLRVEVVAFAGLVNIKLVGNPCVVASVSPDEADAVIAGMAAARDEAREWTDRVETRMGVAARLLARKEDDRG